MAAPKTQPGSALSAYRTKRYGWKPDVPDPRDRMMLVRLAKVPTHLDLRAKMPPVYDQGQLGSCTANALGAAHQYDQIIQGQTSFTPSRLAIYYSEREIEQSIESDAGAFIRDGAKVLNKLGAAPESLWPYIPAKFTQQPPTAYFTEALKHQCTVYARVPRTVNAMKNVLANVGRPIVFGFSVPENFESDECATTGMLYKPLPGEQMLGGHAVLIVGYDDALVFKKSGLSTYKGGFIIRNSWGKDWGVDGYFFMPYSYMTSTSLTSDFWTLNAIE